MADINFYNIYRSSSSEFLPDTENHANHIGHTIEVAYTDTGALSAEISYFYYITAVTSDGTESVLPSPLGCKIRHELTFIDGDSNTQWLAIPQNPNYANASDIEALSSAISQVIAWDATNQSQTIWRSDGTGTDFPLHPGKPCGIVITEDTVINLLGTFPASEIEFIHNPDNFSANWFSLPQPNIYATASELASAIPNLTKVARFDAANDTYESWFLLDGVWTGQDFALTPGEGLLAVVSENTSWTPSHGYPSVTASVDVTRGLNTLEVNLSGAADDTGGTIASYEWDLEGDGVADFSSSDSPDTTHTYTAPGTYYATLVVTDNDGFKGYDYRTVQVHGLESEIVARVFNPSNGESESFVINLTADGSITISLYDQAGTLAATPVQEATVIAGENTFGWDGTDEFGKPVPDGVYHAVLTYTVDGNAFTYDLRATGGADLGSEIENVAISESLSLLEGLYTRISYSLPEIALVNIEIKDIDGNTIRRLLKDAPRVSGAHEEIWDGMDDNGVPVAPGMSFFVDIEAASLADGAFLTVGASPAISDISAAPLRFSPALNPYGIHDNSSVVVDFQLNETADVAATVFDANGNVVRTIAISEAAAGANQIGWNGRRENGVLAEDGLYTIRLSATDASGHTSVPFTLQTEIYY